MRRVRSKMVADGSAGAKYQIAAMVSKERRALTVMFMGSAPTINNSKEMR